jgi:hypothetical protein
MIVALVVAPGCDRKTDPAEVSTGTTPVATEPGHFTGRVTLADGSPVTLPGVKYEITINGVTAVGERNSFRPKVGPDGRFKIKLPQGQFYPPFGTITFPFEGKNYVLPLHPIDPFEDTRDGGPGIVQNFAWRLTGPKPQILNPDPSNATHWYGITIPLLYQVYREDTKESQRPLPDGIKLTWTLTPTSKRIDGGEAKPVTIERTLGERASVFDKLHDLPPANYDVTAVATMPDGSTKRVLMLADGITGAYRPKVNAPLEPYANTGEIITKRIYWVVE